MKMVAPGGTARIMAWFSMCMIHISTIRNEAEAEIGTKTLKTIAVDVQGRRRDNVIIGGAGVEKETEATEIRTGGRLWLRNRC